ncbi:hypothetical protein [Planctomicrobium sp. SH664]|uniref:hypothetical protein n=1 Tax=Planctomicrobium sp. SH664 TaxID=3448125 RepID=UPI003F5CA683
MMPVTLISFEQLSAASLGCYGNHQQATPTFDRLAMESLTCDQYFVDPDGPSLAEQLAQWGDGIEILSIPGPVSVLGAGTEGTSGLRSIDSWLQESIRGREGEFLIVTAARGEDQLIEEAHPDWLASVAEPVAHVPLLIRVPSEPWAGRESALLTTAEVLRLVSGVREGTFRSLGEWQESLRAELIEYRSRLARAVRTRSCLLIESLQSGAQMMEESEIRLFLKPEDVWDLLDVASQHPDQIDRYRATGRL